ncbi:MAG: formyltransferase family protein [Planctomycetota bacterium]
MKRIGLFGCKHTTLFLLEALLTKVDIAGVVTISPAAGEKFQVADYCNLKAHCEKQGVPCYVAKKYSLKDSDDADQVANLKLDLAFVIGWQRLVPEEVLSTLSIGAFGMHGSPDDLPKGRGRSPMNWSLIEGRTHFHTNLFRYDAGVDSGDILDTFVFSIQRSDTAETMHFKNTLAMKRLVLRNLDRLLSGQFELRKQRDLTPTFYPKRTPKDSLIDWHQDLFKIESFVRAVTRPFNGAFSFVDSRKVTIWRAHVFETDLVDFGSRDEEPGTIAEVFPNGKFLVRCRGGLLLVHEYDTSQTLEAGMHLRSPEDAMPTFPTNRHGFHDMEGVEGT